MRNPWLRWLRRIATALAVAVAALALLWAIDVLYVRLVWPWLHPIGGGLDAAMADAAVVEENIGAVAIIAAEALLALLLGIWWLWWRLPQRQVARLAIQISDPKARADAEDNFRKTVGQALGGAAVLIGAGAAYLQFSQQQQAGHDLLISTQVAKGFEQLAGDKLAMRLGGIYGLEAVMNNSPEYHQPVLEALCAFVREGATPQQTMLTALFGALFTGTRDDTARKASDKPTTDIQAALTVIGRRADGPGGVDLSGANLSGANLSHADLSGANLVLANLSGANMRGANLVLANLSGANMRGANLVLANLSGANLSHADLSGANLEVAKELTRAQLDQACGTYAMPDLTLKPCSPSPEPAAPAAAPMGH